MDARRAWGVGPVRAPIIVLVCGAAAVVFVVMAWIRLEPQTLAAVVLVIASLLAGGLVAGAAARIGTLPVVGVLLVLAAGWLLSQRNDPGTIAILAALFGAGLALVCAPLGQSGEPYRPRWLRLIGGVLVIAIIGVGCYIGAETPSVHWFGGGITHGPTNTHEVALTFDDGPNVTTTLKLMRILQAAHVTGTFFEVGKAIDKVPQITQALFEGGELLGNHSYHHDEWRWLDPRYPELARTQDAFRRAIGRCPAYYRPPHGDRTPLIAHVVNDHHMRMIMWNDSASDWDETDPRTIARRILDRVKPGSIIVLHDGLDGDVTTNRTVLVQALPMILSGLRAKHLTPVGLNQLIGGPAWVPCA